jgi:hypothetical protein
MYKEEIVAQLKAPPWHLPRGAEENHQHLNQDNQYPGGNSNQAPPEYNTVDKNVELEGLPPLPHTSSWFSS